MELCLEVIRLLLVFMFADVFLTSHRVESALWNGNLDYNSRVFTMNDTAAPFDKKRLKLFYSHKPDTETYNAIYKSIHNISDPQPTTPDIPSHFSQPLEEEVYRRYFKEISQRQLKNIQDMTYPKRGMGLRSPDIYKLFKIDAINKSFYPNQRSHLKSALDLKNNESVADSFRQSDDGLYGYENKLFSVQLNDKSINNSDPNRKESYFVSYLSDIIPAIEQQIKDGVLSFIEQNNAKTSNDQTQSVKSTYDNVANYEPKSKDDIRYALAKMLKDVYRQYEDVKRIYNVILKIHSEITSIRHEINTKLTSFLSKETSHTEKFDVITKLEQDLSLKQQIFMAKQNEFFKIQKNFNEKQKEFQATQQLMVRNDQKILEKQRELSHQQSEIAKKQEFLATYLKHYITKLKDGRGSENDKTVPLVQRARTSPSIPKIEEGLNKQAYKVTPLRPVTADKIQQIIRTHLDDSDKPTAFLIKINNQDADDRIEKSDMMKRFVEHADELGTSQKDIESLMSKFYSKDMNLDKIMNPNTEYQLGRIVDFVPENLVQLLRLNHHGEGGTEDGLRGVLGTVEDLPKRFKKDRKKRSLDTKTEHNRSYQKLRNRRQNKGKKHDKIRIPEKITAQIDKSKSVVTVVARGNTEKENKALELAQRYCNEIDQNSNELSFNHCINKFLSWNQAADVNPSKMLAPHDSTPKGLSRSADLPVDHTKDSPAPSAPLVNIKTEKSQSVDNSTTMDRPAEDYNEKMDSDQETVVALKGSGKVHAMPGDGVPEDTDGNVYWDASVYGNNKNTEVSRDGSWETSMDAADYPFLDADTLDLMSRRKDYVQKYNTKVLASAKKREEKTHRGRKRKEKAKA